MKTKLLIFTTITIALFTTCKKQRAEWFYTRVSGTVINEVDNKPISNVKFYVNQETYSNPIGRSIFENIDSVYTDESGKYNYKFKAKYESTYTIELANIYDTIRCLAIAFKSGWMGKQIKDGHRNEFDNFLTNYAIAKVTFKRNTGDFLVGDELNIEEDYSNTFEKIDLYIRNPRIFGLGIIVRGVNDSPKNVKFKWSLKLNGIEEKDSIELLIKKCDYTVKVYEI